MLSNSYTSKLSHTVQYPLFSTLDTLNCLHCAQYAFVSLVIVNAKSMRCFLFKLIQSQLFFLILPEFLIFQCQFINWILICFGQLNYIFFFLLNFNTLIINIIWWKKTACRIEIIMCSLKALHYVSYTVSLGLQKYQFKRELVYNVTMTNFLHGYCAKQCLQKRRMGVLPSLSYLNGPMIIKEVVVSLLSNLLYRVKD